MTETALSPEDAAAQRASEQARLRKERREAKIKAGGSARLNKITGLAGGVPRDPEPETSATTTATSAPTPAAATASTAKSSSRHGDPEEVDISQHFYEPKATARPSITAATFEPEPSLSEEQLRQLMLGLDRPGQPNVPNANNPVVDEDPLMKMMNQMFGPNGPGGAFTPGSSSPFANMPNLSAPQPPVPADPYTSLWRLLHALVALGLGLYIAVLTPFTGSKIDRERAAIAHTTAAEPDEDLERRKKLFFWTFATAETLLLTTRFFLDKGRVQGTGIVGTIVGFLPEPYKGYAEIALRYVRIFTTVRADILACIFVLGLCAWWRA